MVMPQQIQEINPKIQDDLDEINKTIDHNHLNFTNAQEDEHAKDLVIHDHTMKEQKDQTQIKNNDDYKSDHEYKVDSTTKDSKTYSRKE